MRDEIIAALEPILFDAYKHSYPLRSQLEDAFATEVQKRYAVAVHSGTVALVIALRACGIGPGDEVITVGNSDISTTGAISLCGATPVLCDVLESDYTMDIATVAAQITERTRAILPVDLHGHPADVKALRALADRYELKIVEDAALASGAMDHGRPVGAFADVAMFSFAPFKPLGSAGNGAMLVTDDVGRWMPEFACWSATGTRHRTSNGPPPIRTTSPKATTSRSTACKQRCCWSSCRASIAWTARRRAIAAALDAGLRDTPVITPRFRPESAPTFRSYAVQKRPAA